MNDSLSSTINIFVDGGARGNPGPSAVGVVVKNEKGKTIHKFGKYIGFGTNNMAEYSAVIEALTFARKLGKLKKVTVFADSELIVSQLIGTYKVKKPHLRMLLFQVRILEQELGGNVSYVSISREENREADRLVNMALDKQAAL